MVEYKCGEVILKSEPFAYALNDCEKGKYCDYCFKGVDETNEEPRPNLKKCAQCKFMYFCNRACHVKAWKLFHKAECLKLSETPLTVTALFVSRIFLKVLSINEFPELAPFETVDGSQRTFASLISHFHEIIENRKTQENVQTLLLMMCRFSPEHFSDYNSAQNAEIIEEIFCKMTINSFEIGNWEMMPIGVGIYLGASFFDHSCDPDAFVSFEGTKSVVRAMKNIKHRDLKRIKVCYIDPIQTKMNRQTSLKEQYYFECECNFCITSQNENEKNNLRDADKALETDVISRTEALLHETKNLNSLSLLEMETSLIKCRDLAEIQKNVLGEFNVNRANLALLGFDLCVNLQCYDPAVEFGNEALKSLIYFKGNDDPSVGLLLFKLGKILLLKDELNKGVELLHSAKNILSVLFGSEHKLITELNVCLMPLEMEMMMRAQSQGQSKPELALKN